MIKAAIFDMDGLLIDSEHFWQQTEREIFRNLGIPVTEEMQKQTFGLRTDEQVNFWYDYKPWSEPNIQSIIKEYDKRVLNFFIGDAELMKGARYILEFFRNRKFTMAIASSSSTILINTFLDRFNLRNYFDIIYSAEHEEYGKPHPAVYLSTVKMMNIEPWNCLVFEDSLNGVISAKAARMKTVAVPDKMNYADKGYAIADLKISSLKDFGASELKKLLI